MFQIVATIFFSFCIFLSIFTVFVPFFPTIFFMLVITSIFSVITQFKIITLSNFLVLGAIFALSLVTDLFSGVLGAKWGGASYRSIWWGIGGLFIGTILFPPFGGIAGLFLGIFLKEFFDGKPKNKAFESAFRSLSGVFTGVLINFFIALAFFSLFVIFLFV